MYPRSPRGHLAPFPRARAKSQAEVSPDARARYSLNGFAKGEPTLLSMPSRRLMSRRLCAA